MRRRCDEIAVDRMVHVLGLLSGGVGSIVMIGIALHRLDPGGWWPILVYSACLLAMLTCSAVYNLAPVSPRRQLLRRLDHAAIFLMIAGTYTPFTARALPENWAVAVTGSVWAMALAGAFLKLRFPHLLERVGIVLYLCLGWMIVVAWTPLTASLDAASAGLIVSGGVLYTIGAGFHAWRSLRFQNAIWHAFVLIAAGCHYAAVLKGVVLAAPRH
jgi:hemolysin III